MGGEIMKQSWPDRIEHLYNEGHERLFKVAYRRTGNWELAQDLVQDAFLLAIFNQAKLMQHPNLGAWLMRTLQNLIANELKAASRKDIQLDEEIEIPARPACESLDLLLPAQLQPKERKILIWRFEQNMSYREMSDRLGVSEALCRKWLSQAVIKCRNFLQE